MSWWLRALVFVLLFVPILIAASEIYGWINP